MKQHFEFMLTTMQPVTTSSDEHSFEEVEILDPPDNTLEVTQTNCGAW